MTLAPTLPLSPMEALSVEVIPTGPDWQYEPKWDGFRCLLFRDGDKIGHQSKSGKPLTRYLPPNALPRPDPKADREQIEMSFVRNRRVSTALSSREH
jgi:ATP-dependent DNA ligase